MLLLITKRQATGGFFTRRRADKGKIPPVITGLTLGRYPAARVELSGRRLSANLPFLAPYQKRGDVLVAAGSLDSQLQVNQTLISEYARRQCVNFCLAAIEKAEKIRRLQVVLIDREGECVGVAAELAAVCDTVMIATARSELYDPCAAYTSQRYGIRPVMLGSDIPPADLLIAPYGAAGFSLPGGVPLAAPDGLLYPKETELFVPDTVAEALTPTDPPALAVTAGLFEAFHPKELMEGVPAFIHYGGKRITPEELLC